MISMNLMMILSQILISLKCTDTNESDDLNTKRDYVSINIKDSSKSQDSPKSEDSSKSEESEDSSKSEDDPKDSDVKKDTTK